MEKISKVELMRIENRSVEVVTAANRLVVTDVVQENKAYDILKAVKKQLKLIEEKRTAITGPLNQSLKETNEMFKRISTPLKEADEIINDKIIEFRLAQDEKAAKEMERREKIQAAHEAKGHEIKELVPVIAETGDSMIQRRWTYDVVDISKVPVRYLQLNLGEVRKAIDGGERDIPGLKIYQKVSLSVRQ